MDISGGRAPRRAAERGPDPGRRAGPAHRRAERHRAAPDRGRVVRVARGDPADGRRRRRDGPDRAPARRRVLGARARTRGARSGRSPPGPTSSRSWSARARPTTSATCAASVDESIDGRRRARRHWPTAPDAGRGDRVDRVRLPLRGRRRARRGSRAVAGAAARRRAPTAARSATPPAWRRRGGSTTLLDALDRGGVDAPTRRAALPQHARHRPRERARRPRPRRDALRRVDRRARRLPVRAGCVRATSSPRTSSTCSRTWDRHRCRSRRARSTRAHLAQELVGRELPGQVMRAGPRSRLHARHERQRRRRHERAGACASTPTARSQGNLDEGTADKLAEQNKLFVRDRLDRLLDRRLVRRGRPARQRARRRPPGRRRGHRHRPHRRSPGVRDGQRPDGEGGVVGRAHGREDRAPHRDRAAARAAGRVPRRLRGRAHHRPGRAVPRSPRCGADLRQPGAAVGPVPQVCCLFGPSAAGGAYIPAFCDVVFMVEANASMYLGLAPHGRGGHRRAGDARGDGRRPHARHRQRVRRQPRRADDEAASTRRSGGCRYLPTLVAASAPPVVPARAPEARTRSRSRPRSRRGGARAPTTCTR